MMRHLVAVMAAAILALSAAAIAAETIMAGVGTPHPTLKDAIDAADHGDTVILWPGTYIAEDLSIGKDLTLLGDGEVTLTARTPVAKGLLVPAPGTVVTIRNIAFEGAASPDKNGAGIRFEGVSLIVDQCTFRNNENGILATGDANGSLVVQRSLFVNNGHGDGYSHGIYQSSGAVFQIEGSVFEGTREGHHLKTLARTVRVRQNRFDDSDGQTSYVVDVTAGGDVVIEDNVIIRRRTASQNNIFNYDTTRGGTDGSITLRRNQIQSEMQRVRLIRNPNGATLIDEGNKITAAAVVPASVPRAMPQTPAVPTPPTVSSDPRLAQLTPAQARAVRGLLVAKAGPDAALAASPMLLSAPPFSSVPGALARFRMRKVGGQHGVVTFGQVFEPGRLDATAQIEAVIGGQTIPLQLDVKTSHADGSVRFAVVTMAIPQTTADGAEGHLRLAADQRPRPPGAVLTLEVPDWTIIVSGNLGEGDGQTYQVRLADVISDRSSAWLKGPLVHERTGDAAMGPLLVLRAEWRAFEGGAGRLRLTFDNHKTFSMTPRDLSYRVAVRDGERIIWDEAVPAHYRNSGWSTVIEGAGQPAYDIAQDPSVLIASGAVPPFDLAQPVHRDALPVFEDIEARPGEAAPLNPYLPTTGGRADIGPMTSWGAAWVITQSPRAKAVMLRAANIGLTIPWHFEEDGTGLPVRADIRHRFWADERGANDNAGVDKFSAVLFAGGAGGWTTDIAHKPQLAYPAFLATGDLVYLRALRHEAAYGINAIWPTLRGRGTLVTDELQLRAAAWSLRSIADAAFILPDNDPFKEYISRVLAENLKHLDDTYIRRRSMASAGETEGYFKTDSGRDPSAIAPWQNDFLVLVLAQEARRGTARAEEVLCWAGQFAAGRVLAAGDDPAIVAGLKLIVLDRTGARLGTWAEVFAATRAIGIDPPYSGSADGGYGLLRAALAAAHSVTGDEQMQRALSIIDQVPDIDKLSDPANQLGLAWAPQFAFDMP